MPGSARQNSMFKKTTVGFVQKNNPSPITSCGRRRKLSLLKKLRVLDLSKYLVEKLDKSPLLKH